MSVNYVGDMLCGKISKRGRQERKRVCLKLFADRAVETFAVPLTTAARNSIFTTLAAIYITMSVSISFTGFL